MKHCFERAGAGFNVNTDIASKYTDKSVKINSTEHKFSGLEALRLITK